MCSALGPLRNSTQHAALYSQGLQDIRYMGKGTYTDCALTNMTYEVLRSPTDPKAVRFAVVITDGHVTGNPCGGMKVAAELARGEDIHIFAVAASRNVDETGLKEIGNSPEMIFSTKLTAVNLSEGKVEINTQIMDRIIQSMVTHRHKETR